MTVPDPHYYPRFGYYIYGYENTVSGRNVNFTRSESEMSEEQPEAPRIAMIPDGGAYNLDGNYVLYPQPKTARVRGLLYTEDYGAGSYDDLLEITAGPGKLWRVSPSGAYQWSPAIRQSVIRFNQSMVQKRAGLFPVASEFTLPTGLWYARYFCVGTLYGYARYGYGVYGVRSAGGTLQYLVGASPQTITVPNAGTAICRAMIVRIVSPAAGTIAGNLVLANTTTGQSLTIAQSIAAGQTLALDTTVPSLTLAAADVWASMTVAAQRGLFWLNTGNNTVTLTHGGVVGADNYLEFEFYDPYY